MLAPTHVYVHAGPSQTPEEATGLKPSSGSVHTTSKAQGEAVLHASGASRMENIPTAAATAEDSIMEPSPEAGPEDGQVGRHLPHACCRFSVDMHLCRQSNLASFTADEVPEGLAQSSLSHSIMSLINECHQACYQRAAVKPHDKLACILLQELPEIDAGQHDLGPSLVGKRIAVLWPEERQFFPGTVISFNPAEVSYMAFACPWSMQANTKPGSCC